ncbi:hypothetical protein [Pseudonocardia asaccharolytica]|uniref:Uncharacterized protein n=1 Tax=Pseudonocardia asaccharolytica DSM 44247 = NBRC 16224 TaxID=1123024 RepID=A0A511D7R8_9PSEU|nr:hypothetical protein [Pseudonocardia asaccharolytica]GEL20851.1 hypothetical protein PA7_46880 [Pseudonocardia asaccharolytica DSM 44247 = NBRC 16224]
MNPARILVGAAVGALLAVAPTTALAAPAADCRAEAAAVTTAQRDYDAALADATARLTAKGVTTGQIAQARRILETGVSSQGLAGGTVDQLRGLYEQANLRFGAADVPVAMAVLNTRIALEKAVVERAKCVPAPAASGPGSTVTPHPDTGAAKTTSPRHTPADRGGGFTQVERVPVGAPETGGL